jgi:hypothetical protein
MLKKLAIGLGADLCAVGQLLFGARLNTAGDVRQLVTMASTLSNLSKI